MITGLDHIQLAAPPGTEDALRAYYADLLGMTEVPKPPALAARGGWGSPLLERSRELGGWFEAGTARLHLGIEADFRPAKKAHPGIRVHGIDAFAARLTAGGATVTWDDHLPGHRRFYSVDPAGNRLEFLEPQG
ncbi:glyoxalase [Streptomyces decoyicus]|uniref:Glyoxalase n=1 Tax=Streptomyces decoyicus TaxID=249567 RepID=A0ABZ1FKI2_9ACTN|nr:VOC family protein [Streptomyces decoyicus]WSB70820.1 glyoxalase [Streptomyces decoyicus]